MHGAAPIEIDSTPLTPASNPGNQHVQRRDDCVPARGRVGDLLAELAFRDAGQFRREIASASLSISSSGVSACISRLRSADAGHSGSTKRIGE